MILILSNLSSSHCITKQPLVVFNKCASQTKNKNTSLLDEVTATTVQKSIDIR